MPTTWIGALRADRDVAASIVFSVVLYGFWLILAGGITPAILVAGIPVVLFPIVLFRWTYRAIASSPIPLRFILLVPFLMTTALEMAKAAIQIAVWTLEVRRPLASWIFAYQSQIDDRLGLLLLSTAITLTPGTISVELERVGCVLHIHALAPRGITTEKVEASVRVLERALMRALP